MVPVVGQEAGDVRIADHVVGGGASAIEMAHHLGIAFHLPEIVHVLRREPSQGQPGCLQTYVHRLTCPSHFASIHLMPFEHLSESAPVVELPRS